MEFNFDYFFSVMPGLLKKIPITLLLGVISYILALVLGVVLSLIQKSKMKVLNKIVKIYISFFRSTPYIAQLFIFYFGLPQLFESLKLITAAQALVISLAMNSSAFISEVIRGNIMSVDRGQMEAGLSLNMSKFDIYLRVIFPQALVSAIPSLGNAFINIIKGTSMGFTIGVVELLSQAKIGASNSYKFLESYVAVGLVYWMIVIIIDKCQNNLERYVGRYL